MSEVVTGTRDVPKQKGEIVVRAQELFRRYGEGDTAVEALRGVSLDVPAGELTAVMGPSGSGKSTLMHILAGLDQPTSGSVSIADTELTTLSDSELTRLRRKHVGFIFQFFNLLPMLSAEENILLPLEVGNRKVDKAWLDEIIGKVGLSKRRDHRPAELSGGEQQRVAIARAVANAPRALLADEPTGNLDPNTADHVFQALMQLVKATRVAMLIATHNMELAGRMDRRVSISNGQVVELE